MKNIELEEFNLDYLNLSFEWLKDVELRKLIDAPVITKEAQLEWFKKLTERKDYKTWGVKYQNIKIGVCGFKNITEKQAEYFGYIGLKEFWGKGIGAMIFNELMKTEVFHTKKFIYLKVNKTNTRAIKAYIKWGFIKYSIVNNNVKMMYQHQ